mmetsp:Transcript_2005/g.2221  ORF Transcript_2005/g.2221 Transcript_2005/m.2221 type:complete len:295 (+) Transcript_2005:27-911(+)
MGQVYTTETPVVKKQDSNKEEPPEFGYHVLQVTPNSPGEIAGLNSFFDFITSVSGTPLVMEDEVLVDTLKTNVDKPIDLVAYNSRDETYRAVQVVPSNSWGGAGFAGISVRFCSYAKANEHVWHVLNVHPASPAKLAGLESYIDYIVGTPELLFNNQDDFYTLVKEKEGEAIPLYVYSTQTDNVRLVTITPNGSWGGQGSLGCDVGYGYLHTIPKNKAALAPPAPTQQTTQTTNGSTETQNDTPSDTTIDNPVPIQSVDHSPFNPYKENLPLEWNPVTGGGYSQSMANNRQFLE